MDTTADFEPVFSSSSKADSQPLPTYQSPLSFPIETHSDEQQVSEDSEPVMREAIEADYPQIDLRTPMGGFPQSFGVGKAQVDPALGRILQTAVRQAAAQQKNAIADREKLIAAKAEESKKMLKALGIAFVGGAIAGILAYGAFRYRYSKSGHTEADE